jgi:hypothetical protein
LAVPNIVSSPTETISLSLGYVIFTPYLEISGTWEIAKGIGKYINTILTVVIVYITMLELNLIGFNFVWGYEAQNRILGLAEE